MFHDCLVCSLIYPYNDESPKHVLGYLRDTINYRSEITYQKVINYCKDFMILIGVVTSVSDFVGLHAVTINKVVYISQY